MVDQSRETGVFKTVSISHQEQTARWQGDTTRLMAVVTSELPAIDEAHEMQAVIEGGMLSQDENGLPIFTPEGQGLVELMRRASQHIVRTAKSLDEIRVKAQVLLPKVESLAIDSILQMDDVVLLRVRQVQAQIVGESIMGFANCFDSNFEAVPDYKQKSKAPIDNASEPASKRAPDLLLALHPEMNRKQAEQRLEKIKAANPHDIHAAMMMIFKITKNEQKPLDIEKLMTHLSNPSNTSWLSEEKVGEIWAVCQKVKEGPTLNEAELRDLIVLLESVHISWAASQFPREKAENGRFTRPAYQQFPAIKVAFTQEGGYELANLEVIKDLVFL